MRFKGLKPFNKNFSSARQVIRHRNIMFGLPIKRLALAKIPFGYEPDPNKEGWLIANERNIKLLYKARQLTIRSTYKDIAEWLSKETGISLTSEGLRSIFRYRPPLRIYLLPLDVRLRIATAQDEEACLEYSDRTRFRTEEARKNKENYHQRRASAVSREEEVRGAKAP